MLKHIDLNNFYAVSLNFEKADVSVRGKFSFSEELIPSIKEKTMDKLFILSTCNRTEIYSHTSDIESILSSFCEVIHADVQALKQIISIYTGNDAVQHLFSVACGLKSQLLGDFEIISQIRSSFAQFKSAGLTDTLLEKLHTLAIETSKSVKNRTNISSGTTSMAFAPVDYLTKNTANLADKSITIVGAGAIGKKLVKNLVKHTDKTHITILNRTLTTAQKLADKTGVQYKEIEQLGKMLQSADIVITATTSQTSIISKSGIPTDKPITLIDLSIPQNIDNDVRELSNVSLINVDELSQIINQSLSNREQDIPKAEAIVLEKMEELNTWIDSRKHAGFILSLKSEIERMDQHCREKHHISDVESETATHLLSNKIINRVVSYINNQNDADSQKSISLLKDIFKL